jgi:hypothetical protein
VPRPPLRQGFAEASTGHGALPDWNEFGRVADGGRRRSKCLDSSQRDSDAAADVDAFSRR